DARCRFFAYSYFFVHATTRTPCSPVVQSNRREVVHWCHWFAVNYHTCFRTNHSSFLANRNPIDAYPLSYMDSCCPLLHQSNLYHALPSFECIGNCAHSTLANLSLLPDERFRNHKCDRCVRNVPC